MSEQPRSGRLDADTLAAYVEGQLPPEVRAQVDAEIAADPEQYEWLVNALRTAAALDGEVGGAEGAGSIGGETPGAGAAGQSLEPVESRPRDARRGREPSSASGAESAPEPVRKLMPRRIPGQAPRPAGVVPFYKRRSVQVGMGGVLAAAAALVLAVQLEPAWWQRLTGSADPRFAKLVAAVGEERDIEGRLTGGFNYGPLRSVTRGPGDLSNQNLALLAAAGELKKKAQEDPSAENLHAWGVAQLLLDNQESLDGSIQTLAGAVSLSGDAAIRSDLAAAYIQRFRAAGELGDIRQAIEESERALAADPGLRPAAFNRAVALELQGAVADAMSAWADYAGQDEPDDWSAEASRRLNLLRQ